MNMSFYSLALIFVLAITIITRLRAQTLGQHQWKNRVLILVAEVKDDPKLKMQCEMIKNGGAGWKDRKVIVYQIVDNEIKQGFKSNHGWDNRAGVRLLGIASKTDGFELLLVGLDGGIKFRSKTLVTVETIFKIIDKMPMRKADLERNG